jgi:hypothetical protein
MLRIRVYLCAVLLMLAVICVPASAATLTVTFFPAARFSTMVLSRNCESAQL